MAKQMCFKKLRLTYIFLLKKLHEILCFDVFERWLLILLKFIPLPTVTKFSIVNEQ